MLAMIGVHVSIWMAAIVGFIASVWQRIGTILSPATAGDGVDFTGPVTSSGNAAIDLGSGKTTTLGDVTLKPLGGGADDSPQLAAVAAAGKIAWLSPGTYNFGGTAYVTARTVRAVNAVGTAQTVGLKLVNATAATAGNQQYSACQSLEGEAWDATAAASAPVNTLLQCRGVQGAAVAQAQFDVLTGKVGAETRKFSCGGAEGAKIENCGLWCDGTTGATPTSGAGTRLMWIPGKTGAIRAGVVTGSLWDAANIGVSSAAFGTDTKASGQQAFACGDWSTASGTSSLAAGSTCTASGAYSFATGQQSVASLRSQMACAGSAFAAPGDAQRSSVSLMRASTDATAVELTLTGAAPAAGTRLTIASGKTIGFRGQIVCRCTAGGLIGESATWTIVSGSISNVGGTTALVGLPQVAREGAVSADISAAATPTHSTAGLAAATAQITADNANSCLKVDCIGIDSGAANTYHWHYDLYMSECA